MITADASKAQRKVMDETPGSRKEAEKRGEEYAQRVGSQFDKSVSLPTTRHA